MRARTVASVVLAAGILLGTSACNLAAPQATTIQYDASDGVSGDVGDIAVRNAMLITEDGETANLVVTVVNRGDSAHSLTVQFTAAGDKVTERINVPANTSLTVGTPDAPTVTLENTGAETGGLFPVYFQYGEETPLELLVPVLDTTLPEYSTLAPSAPTS